MQHQMSHMFAVPLYKGNLGRAFSEPEMKYFQAALKDAHPTISNSASRSKDVLGAEPMQDIRAVLQAHLDNFFKITFNTSNDVRLQITQSWLTHSVQGQSHHPHTHPNSVVSGVLYINLAARDGINFYRNEENLWYELLRREENYYNAMSYFIDARIGDIILFPSNVKHGVQQVSDSIERVSLSFNTFFSGELGRDEFSNALRITVG